MNKRDLRDELVRILSSTLADLERAHRETHAGATHEEAKPENDKDTRALEQSYLARGQAQRVVELRNAVGEAQAMPLRAFGPNDPIALGALVQVEEAETAHVYFIAPQGGGARLAAGEVDVVTPKSPLGRALLGKCAGDSLDVRLGDRVRELEITSVS
jgi:transcription elongation GreA/GreB family factor